MELWALTAPYTGAAGSGFKLAQYVVGQLATGLVLSNVNSGAVPFLAPPQGTWRFVLLLTEYTAAPSNDGYSVTDWRNFADPVVIGPATAPMAGVWWNPNESGSGYCAGLQKWRARRAGLLYQPDGPAPVVPCLGANERQRVHGNARQVHGRPVHLLHVQGATGVRRRRRIHDHPFTSSTTANVALPGGRTTQIRRYFGP